MNCNQANDIPLDKILEKMGSKPTQKHSGGHELWYDNPLREERTPSFSVNLQKNVWKDFGTGEGGRVIDLVIKYTRTDVPGALRWLEKHIGAITLPENLRSHSAALYEEKKPRFEIRQIKPLTNKSLNYYLHERGIKPSLAREYVQEAWYADTETGKDGLFALALKNEFGGYALRNKYSKLAIAPMGFTVIQGQNTGHLVNVFEGVFDFLTHLTILERGRPEGTVIILNSTTMAERAAAFVRDDEAIGQGGENPHVILWFDNEAEGSHAAESVERAIHHFAALDYPVYTAHENYAGYKDLNAYWVATKERFDPVLTPVKKPDPDQVKTSHPTGQKSGGDQLRLSL